MGEAMTLSDQQFYAADVNRWHASIVPELRNCGDTIQSHQMRCLGLVSRLFTAPKSTLVCATRWHDQPEVILGDMPFPAKRDYPGFAAAWDTMERHVIAQYNVPQPASPWERDVVKLVDRMDAYAIALKHAPYVMRDDDWLDALDDIESRAVSLGLRDKVFDIIG